MFTCSECRGDKYRQEPIMLDNGAKLVCEECWPYVQEAMKAAKGASIPDSMSDDNLRGVCKKAYELAGGTDGEKGFRSWVANGFGDNLPRVVDFLKAHHSTEWEKALAMAIAFRVYKLTGGKHDSLEEWNMASGYKGRPYLPHMDRICDWMKRKYPDCWARVKKELSP